MTVKLKNNVQSTLRTEVLSSSTTILLPVGHGARFPTLGAGEYFYATIEDAAGNYEIVQATARVTDTLTVTRGAEGTTARTFAAGSTIEMRVTAAGVLDAAQDAAQAAADAVDLAQFSVTASAAEINILDGVTASTAEINLLDGVTASTAELNILDGVTTTTAEINILDGVTATTAELNILDGVTSTAAELNFTDGVTSAIQTQLDAKQALDADLTAIAGLSSSGIIARTGAGTAAARTVTAGTGIAVTNGDGVSGNPTVAADLASQAEAEAGTDNTKVMTPLRVAQAARPVLGTSVVSTSGTSFDFTGIPSWAKRVTVMIAGVSAGTASKIVQIGAGSITTTGYSGGGGALATAASGSTSSTVGFLFGLSTLAADVLSGIMTLQNITGNTWVASFAGGSPTGNQALMAGGFIALGGTLDRLRITTTNGTDTFDAGTINIMWE